MRTCSWTLMCIAVLASCGARCAHSQQTDTAPESRESRPESRPADFGDAAMTARLRELQPEIEAVLGGTIGAPPPEVLASTPDDMAALCHEQSTILFSGIEGAPGVEELRQQKKRESRFQAGVLLGMVDVVTDRIHIVPKNFREGASQRLLDVILVHEAVHVFQNRRLKLGPSLGRVRSLDEFMGLQALVEGHADWVTRKVADRLGMSDAFAEHRRLLLEIPEPPDGFDPALANQLRSLAELVAFAYVEGEKFVDVIVTESGYAAAVERLFSDPPKSQHVVRNPLDYGEPAGRTLDPAEMGKRLRGMMPAGYRTQAIAAHDGLIRAGMALLDRKTIDEAMAGYRGGTLVIGRPGGDSLAMYYASLLTWAAPEQAGKWFDASIDLFHKKDEAMKEHIDSTEYGERETAEGVTFLFVKKTLALGQEGPTSNLSLLAWKGASCSEIGAVGIEVSKQEMLDLAKRVLSEREAPTEAESAPASRPADAEPGEESEPAGSQPAMVRIEGTVVYDGEDAVPPAFSINFWSTGDEARPTSVATGRDGRFEVELPARGRTRVGMIVADGEYHDDHLGSRIRVAPGRVVRYAIKRRATVQVVVLDAATSRPVKGALVYRTADPLFRAPDPDDTVVPSAATLSLSPLRADDAGRVSFKRDEEVGEDGPPAAFFVRSPHHAWRHVEIPKAAGRCEVLLEPGGSMRIRVENWSRLVEATVALQRCVLDDRSFEFSYPDAVPQPDADGVLVVDGLKTGIYGVLVVRGPFYKDGPLYGTAVKEVREGEVAEVSIATEAGPPSVTLSGVVKIPDGYGRTGRELELKLVGRDGKTKGAILEAAAKLDPDQKTAAFEFPRITTGEWSLIVQDIQWVVAVRAEAGAPPLLLEAPEPCEVEVKVVDAAGTVIHRPDVSFTATEDLRVWGEAIDARWDAEAQVLRFRAAPGEGTLRISKRLYKHARAAVTLEAAGKVSKTVTLDPAAGISVRLKSGGKSFREDAVVTISRSGDSSSSRRTFRNSVGRFSFDDIDGGTWTLRVEDLAGFKPVPPREVQAEIGKATEVVIDLEKAE